MIVNYVENLTVEDAKIFLSGRSPAVRFPKEFRFDSDELRIWRDGSGLILESMARDWAWLDEIVGLVDDDFIAPRDAEHCGTSQYGLNHRS